MRYKLPMERMIDFEELTKAVRAVTLETFLILTTPPDADRPIELLDGHFDAARYLRHASDLSFNSLHLETWSKHPLALDAEFIHDLAHVDAGVLLHENAVPTGQMLKMLQGNLAKRKLSLVYTFAASSLAFEHAAVVPTSSLQQSDEKTTQVLHLAGPLDLPWSAPVFTSRKERQQFFDLAVRRIRPPKEAFQAAKRLSARMLVFSDGRQWLTLHGTTSIDLARQALATALERLPSIYDTVDKQTKLKLRGLSDQIGVLEPALPDDPCVRTFASRLTHAASFCYPHDQVTLARRTDCYPSSRIPSTGTLTFATYSKIPLVRIPTVLGRLSSFVALARSPSPSICSIRAIETVRNLMVRRLTHAALGWLTVFSDYLDMLATIAASRSAMFVSLAPDAQYDGRFAGAVAELRKGFSLPSSSTRIAYADAL